jgi:hypothetical protein
VKVKLFYANWNKIRRQDEDRSMLSRVTFEGAFLEQRPDLYDLIFEWDFEEGAEPEGFLFEQFNVVEEPSEWMAKKRIRSMSTGDVVVYNGKAIIFQGVGTKKIDAPAWMLERTGEVDRQPEA